MIHISENFIIDGYNNRTILRDTIKEKVLSQSHYSPLRDVMLEANFLSEKPRRAMGMVPEDIIIRARSKMSNGKYVKMIVIRSDIKITIDLDLDVDRAPLINGITGAQEPIIITQQIIDPDADAFGVSITGSFTIGVGAAKTKSIVAFFDGPDKGKVIQYDIDMKNIGAEFSGTISADNYFAIGNINDFNKYSLTGGEVGVDISLIGESGGGAGTTGFVGLNKISFSYKGYSTWLSLGFGIPLKLYASNSKLVQEHTIIKNRQCFFCHSAKYYLKK